MDSDQRPIVLFICPSLVGAGVERRVCALVNQLDDSKFKVKLGLLRDEGELREEIDLSKRIFMKPKLWLRVLFFPLIGCQYIYNFLLAIPQIGSMVKNTDAEFVVTFTLETILPMYFFILMVKERGWVWVISEDSNTAAALGESCRTKWLEKCVVWILSRVYRKADFITTVSSSVKEAVKTAYRVPDTRLNTIHNPIDYKNIRLESAVDLNPAYEFQYILAAGRFVKVKQFDLLIHAFSKVRRSRDIKLIILGEGPERGNLERLVVEQGLENDVLLPGFQINPWVFMLRAQLFVVTSKIEGFSNVIVESMAVGCPVIATACGGPQDIIRHEENGVLVDADCNRIAGEINRLLDSPTMRQNLAEQAKLDLRRYEPSYICSQFGGMLERLLIERG